MQACPVCNRKFQSIEALTQHLHDKRDEKHAAYRKGEKHTAYKKHEEFAYYLKHGFSTAIGALWIQVKLDNKPNLTYDEKIVLERAKKFLGDEHKRTNRKLGLPEDTPMEITSKVRQQKAEEARLRAIEEEKLWRAISRESRRQTREKNKEIEQMKKEMWDKVKKDAEDFKNKHPEIKDWTVGKIPMKPQENIELTPSIEEIEAEYKYYQRDMSLRSKRGRSLQ